MVWRSSGDGVPNGPGVADMKGRIAVLLAALKAVEQSAFSDRFGYARYTAFMIADSLKERAALSALTVLRLGGWSHSASRI
jgi:hypothetical protein